MNNTSLCSHLAVWCCHSSLQNVDPFLFLESWLACNLLWPTECGWHDVVRALEYQLQDTLKFLSSLSWVLNAIKEKWARGLPWQRLHAFTAGSMAGLIPDQGTKIPLALRHCQKKKQTKNKRKKWATLLNDEKSCKERGTSLSAIPVRTWTWGWEHNRLSVSSGPIRWIQP